MGWFGVFAPPPPENYNPEDPYADPVALTEHRQSVMREKAIQVEKAKLLREKLKACYITEGVNHMQNCRELAQQYLESIRDAGAARNNNSRYSKPTVGNLTPK